MTLNLRKPETPELQPKLVVFGVGGAGGNAVNNMLSAELEGVEFVAANTDAQALAGSRAPRKIQLGSGITQGLGAGSKPEIGAAAAESSLPDIQDVLTGAHMVFVTAGMGGGTGTGAAPVIAKAAREMGILTVGVVTKPFQFEGPRRMKVAEEGLEELQKFVDTLIIIPNQNLFRIANEKTTFAQAFAMADEVLHSGVRGITDLMVIPGLMNLDFADVRTVMGEMGKAMMGTGESEGPKRAIEAAEAAINNPLLDDVSMKGAKGVLIHITGGMDLTLFEVDEAANRIRAECDGEANIKVGSTFDPRIDGSIRVSVVATGIDAVARTEADPMPYRPAEQRPRVTSPHGASSARTSQAAAPAARAPQAAAPAPSAPDAGNPVHVLQDRLASRPEPAAPAASEPPAASDSEADDMQSRLTGLRRRPSLLIPRAGATATTETFPSLLSTGVAAPRPRATPAAAEAAPAASSAPAAEAPAASAPAAPAPQAAAPKAEASEDPHPFASSEPRGDDGRTQKRPLTFFERVTGVRRARDGQDEDDMRLSSGPARSLRFEPSEEGGARTRLAEPKAPGGDGLFRESQPDDQLEIPAFLRRQAN
ncbi:MAG: cell division protein FtsZ [Alphaproteobacteria bacterium]|nr:cell division protein FtsZ [Alphaproteobacteria bacterium]